MKVFSPRWKPSRGSRCLVKGRAIEARQAMRIGRKVRRHPVEQQSDIRRVQRVDEAGERLGGP